MFRILLVLSPFKNIYVNKFNIPTLFKFMDIDPYTHVGRYVCVRGRVCIQIRNCSILSHIKSFLFRGSSYFILFLHSTFM